MISSTGSKKKNRALDDPATSGRSAGQANDDEDSQHMACSFCARESKSAAIYVKLPVIGSKTKRAKVPYCLHCYYTTSAVRQDPEKFVSVFNKEEQAKQLPQIQQLFSECFLELQQEISEESARAFQKQKKDPLASMMLHHSSANKRKLNHINGGPPPDPGLKKAGRASDGGFLRDVSLPDRLLKTQRQQAKLQQQMIARMNQGAFVTTSNHDEAASLNLDCRPGTSKSKSNLNQRRKGSGKSIWNLVIDQGPGGKSATPALSHKASTEGREGVLSAGVVCKCGSKDVQSLGNVTSRNQDVRKGEIWGTDRGNEVINRFRCNKCGRTWNEEVTPHDRHPVQNQNQTR